MKKSYLIGFSGAMVGICAIGVILAQVYSVHFGAPNSTSTPSGWPNYPQFSKGSTVSIIPTAVSPKITDLSPSIAQADKVGIIVRHEDGRLEEFLIAPNLADSFIKELPTEDKLEAVIPAQSLMGIFPTTPTP